MERDRLAAPGVIVIDTHIWVWWSTQGDKLSPAQQQLLSDEAAGVIGVSAVSAWEVAYAHVESVA